jgi:outer membrane biosynthesis protein TonB
MRVERADAAGLGVALVAHVALLWALGLSRQPETPPPPAMEVSFVEETGLVSSAPTAEPAAASVAPDLGAPEEAAAATPEPAPPEPQRPIPQPAPAPQPAQRQPAPTPQPAQRQAAPTPQPRRPAPAPAQSTPQPQPRQAQQGTGRADSNRGSRLGSDILKGIGDDPVSRNPRPAAAVVSNEARASMDAAILRALLPCQRQVLPAPEARSIRVRVEVTLTPTGNVASARVMSVANDDPDLRIYEQRMRDLAVNVIEQCAPIRGLPAEYYNVPRGWRTFRYVFPNS